MPYTRQASLAKLAAADSAMKVTTDYPVERFMREAKVMQIFEGTNQIQRLVIARQLASLRPEAKRSVRDL